MTNRYLAASAVAGIVCALAGPTDGRTPGRSSTLPVARPATAGRQAAVAASFRSSLDISALDARSRPLFDLKASDLAVLVDGKPRPITRVDLLTGGRSVLLLVDERSLDPTLTSAVRTAVTQLLDGFTPADRLAVVPLSGATPAMRLSADPREPRAAAAGLIPRGVPPADGAMTLDEAQQVLRGNRQTIADLVARAGHPPRGEQQVDNRSEEERRADPTAAQTVPADLEAEAEAIVRDARRMAADEIAAVSGAVAALKDADAPRAVVLIAGALLLDPMADDMKKCAAAAGDRSVPLFVVQVTASPRPGPTDRAVDDWARSTGGAFVRAQGKMPDLARVSGALSAVYRLTFDATDADRDARDHEVSVTTTRKDMVVRAARRWQPQQGHAVAAEPHDTPVPAPLFQPPAPPVSPSAPGRVARDPALVGILARAALYVESYEREFSSVVAEEIYEQAVPGGERRRLRSDYLLVKQPGDDRWQPFRDVFEVDGAPIRDREERLKKLFLEAPPATATKEAARISEESSRYNIGTVFRTVNVPTLALVFLTASAQDRLAFRKIAEEAVEGVATWRLDFREVARPTLIRTREGGNVPATGSVWIDPTNGRVVKTQVVCAFVTGAAQGIRMDTIVTYQANAALGIWVPAQMRETYGVPRGSYTPPDWEDASERSAKNAIVATATYSNFRRFQVTTEERIKR